MNMRFLSSSDIDRIKKSISQPSERGSIKNSKITRKEHLKQLSSKRVASWSDTLESTREAKLKWKREVQEREEERRKEIDKEEEGIREKFRANVIKRAKDLQYEEKEKVKLLRSQQLYTDVVETRKKQMEEKREKEKRLIEEERKWHEHSLKMVQEAERKNKEKLMQQKRRAMENAEEMKKQRIENENKEKKILEIRRKEEEDFIKITEAENVALKEKHRQRKIDLKNKCKQEMKIILTDIEKKHEEMQKREMEDEKKRQDDIARMSHLATARAKLELKHFEERQATRKLLSDRAAEEIKLRSSREVEIFIKEQKAQESKERARKEKELRLKKESEENVHISRQEQIKLRQQRSKKEAEDEILITKQYQQMTLDAIAVEKKKQNDLQQRHLEMRQFQLKQIEEKQRMRIQEKESHLLEAKKMTEHLKGEDDLFREFAVKEMQRFKDAGKKIHLLKKALMS